MVLYVTWRVAVAAPFLGGIRLSLNELLCVARFACVFQFAAWLHRFLSSANAAYFGFFGL